MKNNTPLFIMALLLFSYSNAQKAISKNYKLAEKCSFSIDKVEEKKTITDYDESNGSRGNWKAKPNDKFVLIHLTLINNSSEKITINFDRLFLYEYKTDIQNKAAWLLKSDLLKTTEVKTTIKGNKSIKRIVVFMFPENEKPEYLKLNEQIIAINYDN